ncbi:MULTISPECIES: hypothetical protein [Acinetobacter]|uniref:hypothetical protein n=1 Tax=Acinetobacter TaxID=469 RepID=UPI0004508FED|nr:MULTISPECIES: hypothetical protein [Acinetobacter]EXB48695.1 hypothetical protein J522_0270 [Acinetobacter baumannii 146457]MBJ9956117.1 hypothetical protein [Acinetobacter courvalinii]
MNKHTTNSQLKVDGKMSESGADFVGKLQSIALIILALAVLVAAAGYVIWLLK